MTDLLLGGSAWWAIPVALLAFAALFGLCPGVMLRLLVLLYPKDDPRRRELVAELYVLGRIERLEWVFQQLETALFEGVSSRLAQRRDRRRGGQADDSVAQQIPIPPDSDGQLPPSLRRGVTGDTWEDKEMRNALAAREVSTIYKLLRRRGVSQRQIAAMTGQSQSEVSEILKGREVMAYDVLVRIADGLGVPRSYMGLAHDKVTAARVAEPREAEEPEIVQRRKFLALAYAVATGAHVLGEGSRSWVSYRSVPTAPGRIGMTDVRQVEAATRALRSLDYKYGGGFCRDAVVAQLSWGQPTLQASGSSVDVQRQHVEVAELHIQIGWQLVDAGLIDMARTHFSRALKRAKAADANELVANILYAMDHLNQDKKIADVALTISQPSDTSAVLPVE